MTRHCTSGGRAATCKPIPGAAVDVWHADAVGEYSGFGSSTSNSSFLRGIQMAGVDGKVDFRTIYPGWYQGRAEHIHRQGAHWRFGRSHRAVVL